MNNFVFSMPTRVLFGVGQLNHLHEEKLPGKKALIVTSNGQTTKKYGYLAHVQKELELAGVEHALFDEIRPNPTRQTSWTGPRRSRITAAILSLRRAAAQSWTAPSASR